MFLEITAKNKTRSAKLIFLSIVLTYLHFKVVVFFFCFVFWIRR